LKRMIFEYEKVTIYAKVIEQSKVDAERRTIFTEMKALKK